MSFPNNNQFESTLNRPINQPQTFFHLNPYPNIIQNNPYHYNMSPTAPYSTSFPGVTSVNQDQPHPNKDRRIYLKNFDELAKFLDKNYFHDSPPPDRVAYIRQNIFKELDIEDQGFPRSQSELLNNQNSPGVQKFILLTNIVVKLLKCPTKQRAKQHKNAQRLGNLDMNKFMMRRVLQGESIQYNNELTNMKCQQFYEKTKNVQSCSCCDLPIQEQKIKICTNIQDINNIEISTFLFFLKIKILCFLVGLMIIFSVCQLILNIISTNIYMQIFGQNDSRLQNNQWHLRLSIIPALFYKKLIKQESMFNLASQIDRNLTIQFWIGILMILVIAIGFFVVKHYQQKRENQFNYWTNTPSDYTLMFQDMPRGIVRQKYFKQVLQYQLQKYRKNALKQLESSGKSSPEADFVKRTGSTPIKIRNIISTTRFQIKYDEILDADKVEHSNKRLTKLKQVLISWVERLRKHRRLDLSDSEIESTFQQFNAEKEAFVTSFNEEYNRVLQENRQATQNRELVDLYVIFEHTRNKQFLQKLNQTRIVKCLDRYKNINVDPFKITYYQRNYDLVYNQQVQLKVKMKKVSNPIDIVWTSRTSRYKKGTITILIYVVCLFLIVSFNLISFWITEKLQKFNSQKDGKNNTIIFGLSFLIGVITNIINYILSYIITRISKKQQKITYSQQQSNIAQKLVVMLLINSIVVQLYINLIRKIQNFGVVNLNLQVFNFLILQLMTNSGLTLLKLSGRKLIRIIRINYNCASLRNRLLLSQNQLNSMYEKPQFKIGKLYAKIVTIYLYTCFFAYFQPLVVPFAILNLFLLYWTQKYALFHYLRRPIVGDNSIDYKMQNFIYSGPLFYVMGRILCTITLFEFKDMVGWMPNIIGLILSVIILILFILISPLEVMGNKKKRESTYEQDRICFVTQYEQRYPFISRRAIQQYNNYLKFKLNKMSMNNPQQRYLLDWKLVAHNKYESNRYKTNFSHQQIMDYEDYTPTSSPINYISSNQIPLIPIQIPIHSGYKYSPVNQQQEYSRNYSKQSHRRFYELNTREIMDFIANNKGKQDAEDNLIIKSSYIDKNAYIRDACANRTENMNRHYVTQSTYPTVRSSNQINFGVDRPQTQQPSRKMIRASKIRWL